MSDEREAIEQRTDTAFAASEWADPRRHYRELLRALREQDAGAFDTAVREYESRVAARLVDGEADPVAAWLDYGRRLAALAGGGRTVEVDGDGRAVELHPDAPHGDVKLLLHLPADETAAVIVIGAPRTPSAPQRATMALLAGRAQALPA